MASTAVLHGTKDNAKSTIAADISALALPITLNPGDGTLFSQPYNGTCSSTGTAILLNSTGIQAAIGSSNTKKMIRNVTDGSVAYITANNTNSLATTALTGGSTNLWNSGDAWRIDEFVATLEKITTSGSGVQTTTQYEEVLVIARSTDLLTVASGGRGYNGTSAAMFATGDSISMLVNAPTMAGIKGALYEIGNNVETGRQNIATNTTAITNVRSGSDFFAVATGSSNAYAAIYSNLPAIATGLSVTFKANFTNTGAATFNYNAGGAVAIKKVDGATALASGDIQNGQSVSLRYDGTNWQLLSPIGQVAVTKVQTLYQTTADSTGITAASFTTFSQSYDLVANSLVAGDVVEVRVWFGTNNTGVTGQAKVRIGGQDIYVTASEDINTMPEIRWYGIVQAIGASGTMIIRPVEERSTTITAPTSAKTSLTLDTTANLTIDARGLKSAGGGTLYIHSFTVRKYSL